MTKWEDGVASEHALDITGGGRIDAPALRNVQAPVATQRPLGIQQAPPGIGWSSARQAGVSSADVSLGDRRLDRLGSPYGWVALKA